MVTLSTKCDLVTLSTKCDLVINDVLGPKAPPPHRKNVFTCPYCGRSNEAVKRDGLILYKCKCGTFVARDTIAEMRTAMNKLNVTIGGVK